MNEFHSHRVVIQPRRGSVSSQLYVHTFALEGDLLDDSAPLFVSGARLEECAALTARTSWSLEPRAGKVVLEYISRDKDFGKSSRYASRTPGNSCLAIHCRESFMRGALSKCFHLPRASHPKQQQQRFEGMSAWLMSLLYLTSAHKWTKPSTSTVTRSSPQPARQCK